MAGAGSPGTVEMAGGSASQGSEGAGAGPSTPSGGVGGGLPVVVETTPVVSAGAVSTTPSTPASVQTPTSPGTTPASPAPVAAIPLACEGETPGEALTSGAPKICFTDLVSAPRSGWSAANPQRGAAVTLYGFNLGATRGSSHVVVNGVALTAASDYAASVPWGSQPRLTSAGTTRPTPIDFRMGKVTFHLNSSIPLGAGRLTVVVNGQTSNPVEFTVTNGRIRFVDPGSAAPVPDGSLTAPWTTIAAAVSDLQLADVVYLRSGTYDTLHSKESVLLLESPRPSNVAEGIGFLGYPGENPHLDANTNAAPLGPVVIENGIFTLADYISIANMRVTGHFRCAKLGAFDGLASESIFGNFNRIVDIECVAPLVATPQTGGVISFGGGVKLYGIVQHGSINGDRFDHGLYLSGCPDVAGNDVAWNFIYGNFNQTGANLSVNHQGNRCKPTQSVKQYLVRSNFVSCDSGDRAGGIAIFDLSWDVGEATVPEVAIVRNNVVRNCGTTGAVSISHDNGKAEIFDNIITGGLNIGIRASAVGSLTAPHYISTVVKNNRIDVLTGARHVFANAPGSANCTTVPPVGVERCSAFVDNRGTCSGAGPETPVDRSTGACP